LCNLTLTVAIRQLALLPDPDIATLEPKGCPQLQRLDKGSE
jgi:hypothetical protein